MVSGSCGLTSPDRTDDDDVDDDERLGPQAAAAAAAAEGPVGLAKE